METPDPSRRGPFYTSDPVKAYLWPSGVAASSWLRIFTELNGANDLEVVD